MGTGYNTEVSFKNERFHIQTEDKGAPRFEIVSHVYQGGAILLTKRLSYGDQPDDRTRARWTREMTTTQHKNILKVIQQGGVNLLRAYIERSNKRKVGEPAPADGPASALPIEAEETSAPVMRTQAGPAALEEPTASGGPLRETLALRLLSRPEFRSGETASIKVLVTLLPGNTPLTDAKVIVQIMGFSFRPSLYAGRTDGSGFYTLEATLPMFTTGQAAIKIVAVSEKVGLAELKYEIEK